jgi:hypothetical protein
MEPKTEIAQRGEVTALGLAIDAVGRASEFATDKQTTGVLVVKLSEDGSFGVRLCDLTKRATLASTILTEMC